jgi:hypothetical protein
MYSLSFSVGVDTRRLIGKLNVFFDVSFPGLGCHEFGVDAVSQKVTNNTIISFLNIHMLVVDSFRLMLLENNNLN